MFFGHFPIEITIENWNGLPGNVYGSINLKLFLGAPKIMQLPAKAQIQFFVFLAQANIYVYMH